LQVIWTLMHYGTPPDVSLFDDVLCDRLAAFATAVAHALQPWHLSVPIYNIVNEIGFTSWAAASTNLMHPYAGNECVAGAQTEGYAIKQRLVHATLAAMAAIRQVDGAGARFVQVEPVIHVVWPTDRPDLQIAAEQASAHQWQVWDMLAGRIEPQLGGHAGALDVIGINHYHGGQWEHGSEERLWWHQRDRRRRPLRDLIGDTWRRYGRPMILAETSHVGDGRTAWFNEVAGDALRACADGMPLQGICLYPLIDRPDWEDPEHWHRSGLWDVSAPADESSVSGEPGSAGLARTLYPPYYQALIRWQAHLQASVSETKGPLMHLIVFSHLRWGFVYQRPQHLLSRLSQHYSVLFVEEPVATDGEPYIDRFSQGPNLDVLVPRTWPGAAGFQDDQLPQIQVLLGDYLERERIADYVVWLYTPLALPLLESLTPKALVYDCMDELSAFLHAPAQLRTREARLLKTADLVLTGGPALYEAKRASNPNVHCVPSSVDAEHFAPAGLNYDGFEAQEAARLHQAIRHPRMGFFGVIDERFDLDLLSELADSQPDWQILLAGPVVKINQETLPRRPNIHWLGMQSYARLPYLLAGWDVCLMPFAINDATRFISPTKTLEYLAGEKPVVSTPVRDVAVLYGNAVQIAPAGAPFIEACRQALASLLQQRFNETPHGQVAAELLLDSSWDRSAARVHQLIDAVIGKAVSSNAENVSSELVHPAL
ncbi:MAG: glycosyltransferase, partial [Burkholderiales bacterium]